MAGVDLRRAYDRGCGKRCERIRDRWGMWLEVGEEARVLTARLLTCILGGSGCLQMLPVEDNDQLPVDGDSHLSVDGEGYLLRYGIDNLPADDGGHLLANGDNLPVDVRGFHVVL